ncbi:MAG: DUF951 domain-containing protein [Oscillospiraceae bacterium]|nr:DUF951 domain-containing protein [Oscillospiraceae bacterium]
MEVKVGDTLEMRKAHPCGSRLWRVERVGMDFRIRCLGCGHELMAPRRKIEKNIKSILSSQQGEDA